MLTDVSNVPMPASQTPVTASPTDASVNASGPITGNPASRAADDLASGETGVQEVCDVFTQSPTSISPVSAAQTELSGSATADDVSAASGPVTAAPTVAVVANSNAADAADLTLEHSQVTVEHRDTTGHDDAHTESDASVDTGSEGSGSNAASLSVSQPAAHAKATRLNPTAPSFAFNEPATTMALKLGKSLPMPIPDIPPMPEGDVFNQSILTSIPEDKWRQITPQMRMAIRQIRRQINKSDAVASQSYRLQQVLGTTPPAHNGALDNATVTSAGSYDSSSPPVASGFSPQQHRGWTIGASGGHRFKWQGGNGREIRFMGYGPDAERDPSTPVNYQNLDSGARMDFNFMPDHLPAQYGSSPDFYVVDDQQALPSEVSAEKMRWADQESFPQAPFGRCGVEQSYPTLVPFTCHACREPDMWA